MKIFISILSLILVVVLVISVFGIFNGRGVLATSSLLQDLQNNPHSISTEWVNKININPSISDQPIIQNIINFINDYILTPVRAILVVAVMVINVLIFVFSYVSTYFV